MEQDFNLEIITTNYGEYTLQPAEVFITFNDFTSFNLTSSENIKNNFDQIYQVFEGAAQGDSYIFRYTDLTYVLGVTSREEVIPLTINACYYYKSEAVSDICISKETFGDICSASEKKRVYTSGGPIQVTNVEQVNSFATGSEIKSTLIFEIESVQSGQFYAKDGPNIDKFSCNPATFKTDGYSFGSVRLKSIQIGTLTIDYDLLKTGCGSVIKNLDSNGKSRFVCNINTNMGAITSDFTERMIITFDYIHSQIVTEDLTILPATFAYG